MGGLLTVAGLLAALVFGVWLGLPRRYDQPLDEIDQRLDEQGRHKTVRRTFTFVGFLQKSLEPGSKGRRRKRRQPFDLR